MQTQKFNNINENESKNKDNSLSNTIKSKGLGYYLFWCINWFKNSEMYELIDVDKVYDYWENDDNKFV